MTYWEGIIGCGLDGYSIACLADLLDPLPSMDLVIQAVSVAFGKEFGYAISLQQGVPDGYSLHNPV
jgi:hypothetical protein